MVGREGGRILRETRLMGGIALKFIGCSDQHTSLLYLKLVLILPI